MDDNNTLTLNRTIKRDKIEYVTINVRWETKAALEKLKNKLGPGVPGMDILIKLMLEVMNEKLDKDDNNEV